MALPGARCQRIRITLTRGAIRQRRRLLPLRAQRGTVSLRVHGSCRRGSRNRSGLLRQWGIHDRRQSHSSIGGTRAGYGSAAGGALPAAFAGDVSQRAIPRAARARDAGCRQRQEGNPLRHRRRRRRGRGLARLLWRRELALRYFPRPVCRRSRRTAAGQSVRSSRHPDHVVHSRPLDRNVSRAVQTGGRCRSRDRHARLFARESRSP